MGEARKLAAEVREGLRSAPKRLPAHLLYDAKGSALFERITALPEYYLTRLEQALFERHAAEMVSSGPLPSTMVELGAGSARKSALLLEALLRRSARASYVAIDISPSALEAAAGALDRRFPGLEIRCLTARYEEGLASLEAKMGPKLVLFIGSSIGNLEHEAAAGLLRQVRDALGPEDTLLLGTDLAKDQRVLLRAYDDADGVTARFNLNLLARLNRELGGHFELGLFRHRARWNAAASRIEMHLESLVAQQVRLDRLELDVWFERGETIHTESSVKYTAPMLARLFEDGGFAPLARWTDERGWYADHLLRRA